MSRPEPPPIWPALLMYAAALVVRAFLPPLQAPQGAQTRPALPRSRFRPYVGPTWRLHGDTTRPFGGPH
jgi:hypothetical protein